MGDEEDPAFELAAGNGLGHVVQQGSEAQTLCAICPHAGANPALIQLALDAPDYLEDVIQGVQVVVRASFQFTGEGELGDGVEEPDSVQRGVQGRAEVQGLASASGLLAARIGIGTTSERRGVALLVALACGLLC